MSPPSQDTSAMVMDDKSFATLSALAKAEAGLVLPVGKMTMVQSRLRKRLIASGQPDYPSYCRLVSSPEGLEERRQMISALTTNVSHFFRESHHFDILRDKVVPELLRKTRAGQKIRIWSAGCSSGQEPYSIGMCLLSAAPELASKDLLILGTDIDPAILEKAEAATYSGQQVTGIPEAMRKTYMEPAGGDQYRVGPAVRKLVRFRELNLLRDWPMKGQFDAIFCRNVVIYFDSDTQATLWPRFRQRLTGDGWIFLGHSERISDAALPLFEPTGMTAYRVAGSVPPTARKD
ncbi:protein-glutamate O-methyltransferase [Pseudooceanicola sp. CBS1P-1]|uniref:Chemotaxis protein methyltransferase n=1 Tax=Pseudooceanicola albus TaxID=2692189 RepID=A0A6L7FXE9_9RHOB|nr:MULTISPECIES: protein-glutamate O-methyltransferase [Pseudooceanicola]MBT9383252.1 protein-glutamate O-methyltransferase [Pseudooceanicola endophyticus]MXN16425.1 protein-glutamate O-methyltransferase CheR [Pseudooceanicola albus]